MSFAGFLRNQRREVSKLSRRVRKKPATPDEGDIHDLRVATRRARALLWMLEGADVRPASLSGHRGRLERELRKLTRALGRVRELDVARKDAARFGLAPRHLKRKRRAQARKLARALSGRCRHRLARDLKRLERALRKVPAAELARASERTQAALRNEAAHWERSLVSADGATPRQPALHRLRVDLKRARYALEALGRPTATLPQLQDLLGELHDLEVLQELLGRRAGVQKRQRALIARAGRVARPALRKLASRAAGSARDGSARGRPASVKASRSTRRSAPSRSRPRRSRRA